jgi:hypothetical protein
MATSPEPAHSSRQNTLAPDANQNHWVLKPGGLLTLTTNGTGCETLFSSAELDVYQKPGVVIRGQIAEGRKMYLAYHHPGFFRQVVSKQWEVLDLTPRGMPITGQDLWWLCRRT